MHTVQIFLSSLSNLLAAGLAASVIASVAFMFRADIERFLSPDHQAGVDRALNNYVLKLCSPDIAASWRADVAHAVSWAVVLVPAVIVVGTVQRLVHILFIGPLGL